jgi:hypothetical protein
MSEGTPPLSRLCLVSLVAVILLVVPLQIFGINSEGTDKCLAREGEQPILPGGSVPLAQNAGSGSTDFSIAYAKDFLIPCLALPNATLG